MIALYCMAQLLVRKLDDSIVNLLKERAEENGISAEEEHRRILQRELRAGEPEEKKLTFTEFLVSMPLEEGELEIEPRDQEVDESKYDTMFD